MGFFNWAAPMFGHFADRWSPSDIEQIAGWLRPHLPQDCRDACSILDVGGGTGALALRLHEALGANVTVLDPTPQMLRYIPAEGPVHCVLGTAESMPFDDDAFDAVVVTDAFHHFRDQPGAVREFRRVVRPGGGVLVVELDPSGVVMRVIVLAEKLLGEPGAFFTPSQMCGFMSEHGIEGSCSPVRGVSYRFLGEVVR
jgi:demethylmenaquinone methyltransferase/2-methoxy-6-polyprenyl-1,4-benzoquinol methylase